MPLNKKIISFLCVILLGISFLGNGFAAKSEYLAVKSISPKTKILIGKYPEVHKKVDVVLGKVYKKIGERSLEKQKKIYILLQNRIDTFKEKYQNKEGIIIVLNYINESVGVQIYNIDKTMEEPEELNSAPELKEKETQKIILSPPQPITPKKRVVVPKKSTTKENIITKNVNTTEDTGSGFIDETTENTGSEFIDETTENTGSEFINETTEITIEDIVLEEEQTLRINEIGRFSSAVNMNIESLTLIVIGDRDFTFENNTLYIKDINGETLGTSLSFNVIGGNYYEFNFENIHIPEGLILLQTNQFSIDDDAYTEVTVKTISIPGNQSLESELMGSMLLEKDRIELGEDQE